MSKLVAFDSTHAAIKLEKLAKEAQLKARLIGTPESISASCGLTLKLRDEDLSAVVELIKNNDLEEAVGIYTMIDSGTHKVYEEIEVNYS